MGRWHAGGTTINPGTYQQLWAAGPALLAYTVAEDESPRNGTYSLHVLSTKKRMSEVEDLNSIHQQFNVVWAPTNTVTCTYQTLLAPSTWGVTVLLGCGPSPRMSKS